MSQLGQGIIDRDKLASIREELGAAYPRIFSYYVEDGDKAIAAIEDACRQRSAVALVRPAHTLKGDSLQFGAERLGMLAEVIEKAARCAVEARDFPEGIGEQVTRLRPLFAETIAKLREADAPVASPVRRAMGFGRKMVAAR